MSSCTTPTCVLRLVSLAERFDVNSDLLTYITGALATVLGGWNARQASQLRDVNRKVARLIVWQGTARRYIGRLVYTLERNGINAPVLPKSLGLEDVKPRKDV